MIKCNECGKEDIGFHKCQAEQPDIPVDNIVRNCDHLYGYWQDGEDCIVYDKKGFERNHCCNENGDYDTTVTKFNYCPICGTQI